MPSVFQVVQQLGAVASQAKSREPRGELEGTPTTVSAGGTSYQVTADYDEPNTTFTIAKPGSSETTKYIFKSEDGDQLEIVRESPEGFYSRDPRDRITSDQTEKTVLGKIIDILELEQLFRSP